VQLKLTAVFRKVPEGYIGFVEELPGANTQAATLDEARENLRAAALMVLEANRLLSEEQLRGEDVIREPLHFPRRETGRPASTSREARLHVPSRRSQTHAVRQSAVTQDVDYPSHNEINEFLARKICRDLDVPVP
jgi:predicted RNase H-like HicB family nuclease